MLLIRLGERAIPKTRHHLLVLDHRRSHDQYVELFFRQARAVGGRSVRVLPGPLFYFANHRNSSLVFVITENREAQGDNGGDWVVRALVVLHPDHRDHGSISF